MLVFSFFSALVMGNMQTLSDGITDAAANAVAIATELLSVLMLWCGPTRRSSDLSRAARA